LFLIVRLCFFIFVFVLARAFPSHFETPPKCFGRRRLGGSYSYIDVCNTFVHFRKIMDSFLFCCFLVFVLFFSFFLLFLCWLEGVRRGRDKGAKGREGARRGAKGRAGGRRGGEGGRSPVQVKLGRIAKHRLVQRNALAGSKNMALHNETFL